MKQIGYPILQASPCLEARTMDLQPFLSALQRGEHLARPGAIENGDVSVRDALMISQAGQPPRSGPAVTVPAQSKRL